MGLFGIPSKKERELKKQQIINCQRIFAESLKIMMSTADIDTFISRYNVARESIYEAGRIAGENSKCMADGITPREALETLDRDLPMVLNPCIERYMRKQTIRISGLSKGRISKAKGLHLIADEYENEMPKECFDYFHHLINKLVNKIEKLDSLESPKSSSKKPNNIK